MTDLTELKRLAKRLLVAADITAGRLMDDECYLFLDAERDILSLIQRVEEAEADRELFATPIAILQERSHEEGRLAGIEEAAKVADRQATHWEAIIQEVGWNGNNAAREASATYIAQAIRALKEKAE